MCETIDSPPCRGSGPSGLCPTWNGILLPEALWGRRQCKERRSLLARETAQQVNASALWRDERAVARRG
eukprot:646271-Pyramimonas_sp.AAC.1